MPKKREPVSISENEIEPVTFPVETDALEELHTFPLALTDQVEETMIKREIVRKVAELPTTVTEVEELTVAEDGGSNVGVPTRGTLDKSIAETPVPALLEEEGEDRGVGEPLVETLMEQEPMGTVVETPVPPFVKDEGDDAHVEVPVDDSRIEQELFVEIADTPCPAFEDEEEDAKQPVTVGVSTLSAPVEEVITPVPLREVPARESQRQTMRLLRAVLACALLVVLIASAFLLGRDSTDTYLSVYTLDASTGQIQAQQDIGGGYQGKTTITAPVQIHSSLLFGVQTDATATRVQQQVYSLTGNDTALHVQNQFSVPLAHGTLSGTPNGYLVVENATGVQVTMPEGHLLWQVQGTQPTLGEHPFQPAFDDKVLYTIRSTTLKQVAAYDIHTGTLKWTQTLDDTLNYAAPLLLSGNTLYLASDSELYALNTTDGGLRWKAVRPSRTLLMVGDGQNQMLLSAGAQGLAALNPDTGALIWSFDGTGNNAGTTSLTPTQFYQASALNTVVYAVGVAGDTAQVREQLWLYAVDATTGTLRWSQPLGSGFVRADAGRTFAPLLDKLHGLVVLQQQADNGDFMITAFDANEGKLRWTQHFKGITAVAPSLLQTWSGSLILPGTVSGDVQYGSPMRFMLQALLILSVLGLLLWWLLPMGVITSSSFPHSIIDATKQRLRSIPRYLIFPVKLLFRLWRFSRLLVMLILLALLIGGGMLEYVQLNQVRSSVYQVAIQTGSTQWQHTNTTPVQALLTDVQGSLLNTTTTEHLHQLSAFDQSGVLHWKTFASEGTFSLATASYQPGKLVASLSGHTSQSYEFAPDDPAYPRPLDSELILYLLNRTTGQTLWQSIIVNPGEQQSAVVLGADTRYIYVASTQTSPPANSPGATVELIAVDQATGSVGWHIFGPVDPIGPLHDDGKLFTHGRQLIWQVAAAIYSIDTTLGQIEWRQLIPGDNQTMLLQEEAQMAALPGALVVARSNTFYALNIATGGVLWTIASPAHDTVQSPIGVVAIGSTLLLYGGGTIQAFDATTRQPKWSQKHLKAVQSVKVSDDGTMVYVMLLDSVGGDAPVQSLAALDSKTGSILWTFQPSDPATFVHVQTDGFQYHHGVLLTTICSSTSQTSCTQERLYAIDGHTGKILWKVEGNSISDVHLSLDGSTVLFQMNRSPWLDLVARFRN